MPLINVKEIEEAKKKLSHVFQETPCEFSPSFSKKYNAEIYFKREDKSIVRSYKFRGAYNKIQSLTDSERLAGIVCASAGNHSQGVAYCCQLLKVQGRIFMPETTPKQKKQKVLEFGGKYVDIEIVGDTFDETNAKANEYAAQNKLVFVHPFDDEKIIAGQGTVGLEILEQVPEKIDYVVFAVGGGGLGSGLISLFQGKKMTTKCIGVEPTGAPSMKTALEKGKVVKLDEIDVFIDGASVKQVGKKCFDIFQGNIERMLLCDEGRACTTILELYNNHGIVVEPAGALSLSVLDDIKKEIEGKTVVCLIGGGNNDITRMNNIREKSMVYEGIRQYFRIQLPQRSGALKQLLIEVIGEEIDIIFFEYQKKIQRETGPVLLGVELPTKEYLSSILKNLDEWGLKYEHLNKDPHFISHLL